MNKTHFTIANIQLVDIDTQFRIVINLSVAISLSVVQIAYRLHCFSLATPKKVLFGSLQKIIIHKEFVP